ncbi:MAG: ATP-binding protein [Ignavibacteriaceae bacterium]|nr:ATP-binding protein [Ignavibacteriaceae bacterium]
MKNEDNKIKEKELSVKSKTNNLSMIRDFVYNAATEIGFSSDVIDNIILAVDEACTNIIKHAYKSYPEGEITVKLKYADKKFTIIIMDHGTPFKPETVPDPDLQSYYRQHRVGGLGMYLMKSLMDEVKYVSVPGKYNQVLLSKNLNSALR